MASSQQSYKSIVADVLSVVMKRVPFLVASSRNGGHQPKSGVQQPILAGSHSVACFNELG